MLSSWGVLLVATTVIFASTLGENSKAEENISKEVGVINTGRDLDSSIEKLKEKFLSGANSVFNKFGMLECNGVSPFQQLFGQNNGKGNSLCGNTCGGECIPYEHIAEAPDTQLGIKSHYAFGCKCPSQRCTNFRGPVLSNSGDPRYRIACDRNPKCSCGGMAMTGSWNIHSSVPLYTGYLCRWVDTHQNPQGATAFENLKEQGPQSIISPLLTIANWCSCCPIMID